MPVRYINDCNGEYTIPLTNDEGSAVAHMLWGDRVVTDDAAATGGFTPVTTGRNPTKERVWVPTACLTEANLLEIYVIDVGQGDGILMRTPDDRWHVIDAGVANAKQMTKKGAANFIWWKFAKDLLKTEVALHSVMISHPDSDHFGGLLDLLAGRLHDGREFAISVEHFYHSGMGRFAEKPVLGQTKVGTVAEFPCPHYGVSQKDSFIVELLDGKSDFANPPRPLAEEYAKLAELVAAVPKDAARLDYTHGHVPGYGPEDDSGVVMHILGPIVEDIGEPGLRVLGDEGVNRNGHSIVLRLDYGNARLLLTGDLNTASQRLLLSYIPAEEFTSDVAKGCHHGSDEIDLRFVRAMAARATVISSGDNEDYAHPRPRVMGASARYGRESQGLNGEILPPLLYSTELARSVKLAYAASVRKTGDDDSALKAADTEIKAAVSKAEYRPLPWTPISTDLIYGLVNIRTDGDRILCATMEEKGHKFDIQVFHAGVMP